MVSSPFNCSVDGAPSEVQMELIGLQSDTLLAGQSHCWTFAPPSKRITFNPEEACSEGTSPLWIYLSCEKTFSVTKFNKSKNRSPVTDDHLSAVLCIATSDILPDLNAFDQALVQ